MELARGLLRDLVGPSKVPNAGQYRVTMVVGDMGWVDFDWDVPPGCLGARPILPNSHLPTTEKIRM